MPPAAQAAIQAFDDELDDEAYVAMLSQLPSDTVAALQMLRGQVRRSRLTQERRPALAPMPPACSTARGARLI